MVTMQPASSSVQPATTTHVNTKRVREAEVLNVQEESSENPLVKKSRLLEGGELKVKHYFLHPQGLKT